MTRNDALFGAISSLGEELGETIVAQIEAPCRLSETLEEAYTKYQSNGRMLGHLQRFGLTSFDIRPEMLMEAEAQDIARHVYASPRIRMP